MRIRLHWKLALLCGVAAGLGFILGQSAIAPRFFWAPPALIILGAAPLFFILFSRPLKMIIACTRSIANGDFLCRPKLRRNDEIGELGLAMAEMAEAISVRFEKIKQEAARAATVFSSMSEGVILTDEKGGILLINPSARKLFFLDTSVEGKIPLEALRNLVVQDTIDRVLQEDAGL
ncbi:MAG: HAMP domain-containing protein, partial [Candidatus Omnitrophota bacterium]